MLSRVAPPTLSALPAVNHLTLFAAFQDAFNLGLDSIEMPAPERPVLVKTYPKARLGEFDHQFDVILFHIVGCEIASTANSGERKPKGYWGYSREKHPTKNGYSLVRSWWQEAILIDFTVLAKDNDRADELVDWLHRLILQYAHGLKFFQARGINEFRFQRRLEDVMTKEYGQELYGRSLQYSLRLELNDTGEEKLLETVTIAVNGEQIR